MNQNSTISWEYAVNFEAKEARWNELLANCQSVLRVFSKNTLLQFKFMHQYLDLLEMHSAILDGDRSEFLYNKTKEMIDGTEKLESVGNDLKKLFLLSKKQ